MVWVMVWGGGDRGRGGRAASEFQIEAFPLRLAGSLGFKWHGSKPYPKASAT